MDVGAPESGTNRGRSRTPRTPLVLNAERHLAEHSAP